jgi:hypothetical protein
MFWKSDSSKEGLERRLRRARPEPSGELVAAIEGRLRPARARRGSRMAFAAAFATFVLGAVASAGGVSYAATATTHSIHTVKVIVTHHAVVVKHSAAHSQYDTPVKPTSKPAPAKAQTGGIKGTVSAAKTPKTPPTVKTPSTLPFTGLSLASTAVLGFALIALGLFLRRREIRS